MTKQQQDDLEYIEGLASLMKQYRLDVIDLGSIKLLKSQHELPSQGQKQVDQDDPFYSSDD
jgi:hypothetical protein